MSVRFWPPHLRTAPTSFGELLRGCGPHPRHRDSVHVPDVTVSSTGEEAFERAARSIEKYLTDPRPVPLLFVGVFESPELTRQRRDRTSHLAQGHIDAKLAAGEALAMGRKRLDLQKGKAGQRGSVLVQRDQIEPSENGV